MKFVVSGGGTGGHFYPALTVLRALQNDGHQLFFVGSSSGIEAARLELLECPVHLVQMSAFVGGGWRGRSRSLVRLMRATRELRGVLRTQRPDGVLCFGGYASAAAGLAAASLRIPLFVHEQNAVAGLTNRLLAPLARQSFSAFGNLGTPVGLPLRLPGVVSASDQRETLLILGGSQGSQYLNDFVADWAPQLLELGMPLVVQAGEHKLEDLRTRLRERWGLQESASVRLIGFSDELPQLMRSSALAISRSGAGAAFELMQARVPTIFIPFPYAAGDHQYANAQWFVRRGCAAVYRQEAWSVDPLGRLREFQVHLPQYRQALEHLEIQAGPDKLVQCLYAALRS